jgi:hypothetical protein
VRRSLEHPPGYVQNSYASGAVAGGMQHDSRLGGTGSEENTDGCVWDGVTTWAAGAGEKLADAEKQAWKWALGK